MTASADAATRAISATQELAGLLRVERLTHVVDIGANPIDGEPPYRPLMDARLCRITGFEPQEAALAKLNLRKGSNETYLGHALGDGKEHTLHICAYSGWTSIYRPSAAALEVFESFKDAARVVDELRIHTHRLDDVEEINAIDLLKIDIQGAELMVFANGREKLKSAAVIHTETQFVQLYEGQPTFNDIDRELRAQGFIPHKFAAVKGAAIGALPSARSRPLSQMIEADVVYVRDIVHPDDMGDDQLKQLGLIAHACYGSYDLTGRCIALLEARQAISTGALSRYVQILES